MRLTDITDITDITEITEIWPVGLALRALNQQVKFAERKGLAL